MVKPLSSPLIRELEAARTDIWRQQCEVVQRFGQNRLEVGFTTEEGNEALIAAGLPTLDSEQMKRALRAPQRSSGANPSLSKAAPFKRGPQANLRAKSDERRAHERRWREILDELGPDIVRARFSARTSIWGDRYEESLPPNDFIVAWLAEKYATSRKIDARRFLLVALMTFSTLIATCFTLIAAWIAAYPVLCRWLPDTWISLKRLCS